MKKITDSDWKHIRADLYRKGMNETKREKLEMAFLGDKDQGKMTYNEYEKTMKEVRKHASKWNLSESDLEKLDEIVQRRMH